MTELTRRLRADIPELEPDAQFIDRLATVAAGSASIAARPLRSVVKVAVAVVAALLLISGAAYAATKVVHDSGSQGPAPAPPVHPSPTPRDVHPTRRADVTDPVPGTTSSPVRGQGQHGNVEDRHGTDDRGGVNTGTDGASGEGSAGHGDGSSEESESHSNGGKGEVAESSSPSEDESAEGNRSGD